MKRVAVLCILRAGDEMLLLQRSKEPLRGMYVPVGGHVEPFEAPREAAIREVREEAGVTLPGVTYRGTLVETSPTAYNWIVFVYEARVERFEPPACAEGELTWVADARLPETPVAEVDRVIYRLVAAGRPFMLHATYDAALRLLAVEEEISGEVYAVGADAPESSGAGPLPQPPGGFGTTPHHVRRVEREITDREEMYGILARGRYMTVALCDGAEPYVVTLSYGLDRRRNALYVHCAKVGHKQEIIRANPLACATVVEDGGYLQGECAHRYRSVVVRGAFRAVEDPEEKRHAMEVLLAHLEEDPDVVRRTQLATAAAYDRVAILRLDIASVTGKQGR